MGRHGTIANRKEKQDAKRAQIFTKYARLITVAAREGGADLEYNAALKNAVDKAKGINMPNDNINRAIKKGAGGADGDDFERITYEGYGINGIAMMIEVLTDNRNRTGSNVRFYFDKNGGNLGTPGCVSYMFDRKGQMLIEKKDEIDEDELMEVALESGAEDFIADDEEVYEVLSASEDFYDVKNAIQEKGYEFLESDISMIPQIMTKLDNNADVKAMNRLIDMLEEDDDIQQIYHNWEMPEE